MAYEQQAGRSNVESAAINYLTDGDKKKKKQEGKSTTTTTSVTGVTNPDFPDSKRTGTLYTDTVTTTIDGTSGRPSVSGDLPKKTYAQLEAEGGDVAAAKAYNASKNISTPGSSNSVSTNRFKPDDIPAVAKMKPYGIKTQTILPTAPVIPSIPLKKPDVTIAVSRGAGVNKTVRRNASRLGGQGGASSYTQDKKTVSSEKASSIQKGVAVANQELENKYSAKNITANLNKRGVTNPAAIQRAINKGKTRINANTTTIDYYKKN